MSWIAREHDPDWPFDYVATEFVLAPESTALFVIDLQQGDMVTVSYTHLRAHETLRYLV